MRGPSLNCSIMEWLFRREADVSQLKLNTRRTKTSICFALGVGGGPAKNTLSTRVGSQVRVSLASDYQSPSNRTVRRARPEDALVQTRERV